MLSVLIKALSFTFIIALGILLRKRGVGESAVEIVQILMLNVTLPAAIIVSAIYMYYGMDIDFIPFYDNIEYIKILPYFFVILLSVLGINVLLVLSLGTLLCGIMGMFLGCFDVYGWFDAMLQGIDGMAPFAIVILLASGLIALIHHNGGIEYVVKITTKHVVGRKSAEFCICILRVISSEVTFLYVYGNLCIQNGK